MEGRGRRLLLESRFEGSVSIIRPSVPMHIPLFSCVISKRRLQHIQSGWLVG